MFVEATPALGLSPTKSICQLRDYHGKEQKGTEMRITRTTDQVTSPLPHLPPHLTNVPPVDPPSQRPLHKLISHRQPLYQRRESALSWVQVRSFRQFIDRSL
jgi:hypothetical protein